MTREVVKAKWGKVRDLLVRQLIAVFVGPIPVMIALGVWHLEIDSRVPALGYWPTLGIMWGLGALLAKVKSKWDLDGSWR